MKIMDCTLRDGANVLGNGFPRELTEMMGSALSNMAMQKELARMR